MSFFRGMIIGQYVPLESTIHSLTARTKIIAVFLMVITLFFADSFQEFGLVALFGWLILLLSRLSLAYLLRGLRPLLVIFLFTWFIHLFMTDGTVIWHWKILSITQEGVIHGTIVLVRLLLLVIFTTLMTLSTSPIDLADGLETLLKPLKRVKFPVHEFALMMTIALRFIPTLVEEIEKIEAAQKARGADFVSGGIVKRVMNFLPILIPLFIISFRRADELALAMESRCYRGDQGRTKYLEERFGKADLIALVITISFMIPFIVNRFQLFS
jgi:energy-coupling factor transport system permease protein